MMDATRPACRPAGDSVFCFVVCEKGTAARYEVVVSHGHRRPVKKGKKYNMQGNVRKHVPYIVVRLYGSASTHMAGTHSNRLRSIAMVA